MFDLMNLPDVQFAELNPEVITRHLVSFYEEAARQDGVENWRLFDGDKRRLFLLSLAYYLTEQNNAIDQAGKMNLLRFSEGAFLDQLAGLYGERGKRLLAAMAVTTIEFTLSAPRPSAIIIEQGSRVSPGNNIFFATDRAAVINPGEMSVQVTATCLEPGAKGNGFEPGEINILVDRNSPFVESAVNVTTSMMGADIESDDEYRQRVWMLPESFSVAGPDGAYMFWAMTASQEIVDVGVTSPEPGEVNLFPLMRNGELPTQDVLNRVLEICSDRTRRPLTDLVHAIQPDIVTYNVDFTYWISRENVSAAWQIQEDVQRVTLEYTQWQKSALRRDINPDQLIRRVTNVQAKRLEVRSPAFTVIGDHEVAVAQNINLVFGGLEDG